MSKILASTVDHTAGVKVLIIGSHAPSRAALEQILDQPSEFKCVGSYADGDQAIREALYIGPDLALMDIHANATSGLDCVRRLKGVRPAVIPVLITGFTDRKTTAEAVAAGVEGYLAKPFSMEQCLATLRFVLRRTSVPERLPDPPKIGRPGLTNRENQVLEGLAKGLLYKEIADQLGISFSAVHKYQHNIFVKLQVSNRTEAIAKWREG